MIQDNQPAPVALSTPSVVIVGSGPVGMVLALYLARLGVQSMLVEQDEETLMHPKGNTHNARTMEHYRQLGLAARLRTLGLPPDMPTDVTYLSRMNGVELYRHRMPSSREKLAQRDRHDPLDQIPEPMHRVNQMYVERAVSEAIRANTLIESCYGWRLHGFTASDDTVAVHLSEVATGRERQLATRFLVGCDGPRSMVREALGFRYVGEDALYNSLMAGTMLSTYVRIRSRDGRPVKPSPSWQYWLLLPDKVVNLVTLDGGDEFIFTSPQLGSSDPAAIRQAVIECVGFDADVEVISSRSWTSGRALVAEHYRRGPVFLCGDAIHLFTPTGGFGMNTGVDDAANLAWKLAFAVRGWGGPRLLDSYETERRPIGVRNSTKARGHARNINEINLSTAFEDDSAEGAAARAACAAVLATLKEEFASIGIQLGARYDGSAVIAHEPGQTPPEDELAVYHPTSLPGGRAPHVWLPDGASLYDRLGPGFTLLRFDPFLGVAAVEAEAARRGMPFAVVDFDLAAARTLYPMKLALVRPDQYVAWRGDRIDDAAALLDLVAGIEGVVTSSQITA